METGKPEKILRKLSKFLLEINQEKGLPEPLQAAIMIKMNKEEAENIIRDIVNQHIFDLIDIDGECEDREDIEKALEILIVK